MSDFRIGSVHGQNVQVGDNNNMVVHPSFARLEAEVARHRGVLSDPSSVDRAVEGLRTELSAPAPRKDRLTELVGTIDANAAGAPAVLQSVDEVRRMLGITR